MKWQTLKNIGFGVLLAAVLVSSAAPSRAAKKVKLSVSAPTLLEAWPGQRVLMMLPLQLGPGWNIDADFGRAILPEVEQNLQNSLRATGKFSVIQPYRFNPILQRAVQEGRITRDQLTALVNTPSLENARIIMGKLDPSFDQTPFIGQFTLEEARLTAADKGTTAQVQVTGRLYEVGSNGGGEPVVVTSNSVTTNRTTASVVGAAMDGFERVAAEFVRPVAEPVLVAPAATTGTTPKTSPANPDMTPTAPTKPATPPTPVIAPPVVPPVEPTGGMVGAPAGGGQDVVPQLPAAQPPLGITVPDVAATVGH